MFKNYLLNKNSAKRIQWIDNSKGICMFLVIVVHSGYMPEVYKFFLEPFFLSAFFFLSGYLFHRPYKAFNFKMKFFKILETILLPYLLYWVLSYTVDHIIKGNFNVVNLLGDILMGNKLWFIAALFVSQILFSIILAIKKSAEVVALFSIGSLILWYTTPLSNPFETYPWSINASLVANFFIGVGYILRLNKDVLDKSINKQKSGILFCAIYILLVALNYSHLQFYFNYPANAFGNILVFIFYSLLGVYCLLFVANQIKDQHLLLFVGANSLLYYFFQNQILKILKALALQLGAESPNYITPLLMSLAVVIILIIPILLVEKYVPVMTGKNRIFSRLVESKTKVE